MKGTIRENLGASRYVVGVTSANQPLAKEIQKYQDLYDATIPKVTEAYGHVNELRAEYQAALDVVAGLIADYEICRLEFSLVDCTSSGNAACEAAYLAADAACLEIESEPGECDADCQRERLRCQEKARSARTACLSQVGIDCTEKQQQHLSECQKTWSPQIAAAQKAALSLYPGIQAAMYDLQHELALQWQLAQKLNELEAIQAREHQITCFSAQWNEDLTEGTEVEMAKTPNERFVITSIIPASTPCLHDARVLPSGHLFINASIAPGSETWRPTWRVGTVKEVMADTLKVEFVPANMPGGLGTIDTIRPIDCTPPQCYFDGKDPVAAEADIKAARTALKEAQQALLDAVAVRDECLEEFDQTWFNLCYQDKTEACDAIYGDAIEQAEIDKGACYETATSNCETTVNEGLAACSEQFQPTIDEKQGDVDAAQANLDEVLAELEADQIELADIQAQIQECIDEINTPEWQAKELEKLLEICAREANDRYTECRDDGGSVEYCNGIKAAYLEVCAVEAEEVMLPAVIIRETEKCTTEEMQARMDWLEQQIDILEVDKLNKEIILRNATESLEAAQQDLKDCQDGFVLADCIANAIQLCDDTYQQAQDTYTQQKAACYQEGLADCDRQRDEAIQACYDANAEAIDAAQATVDDLTRDLELALAGVYQPANPLILDCPVAHCIPERYQVGDQVLIDFPVRTGSTAMASWDSRRVIGWATETRVCITWHIWYYSVGDLLTFTGEVWQPDIPDGRSGTPITANDRADTGSNAYYAFLAWNDEITSRTRQEVDVRENLNIEAFALTFPYHCNTTIGALFGESPEVPGWYIYQYQMIIPWLPMEWIDSTEGMHINGGAFTFYPSYPFAAVVIYTSDPFEHAPSDPFSLLPQDLEFSFTVRHIESGISRRYDFAGHSWVDGVGELGLLPGTQTVSRT